MKRFFVILLILIVSLIIGILAILTAIKLTSEKAVTPNAPQVKPRAEETTPTIPPSACTVTFTLNPTPTGQPNPTITPTSAPNIPPTCTGLSASPTSGDAPLLVTFVASGFDDNAGYIAGFQFNFGDGQTKKIEQTFKTTDTYTITHSYSTPGSYVASVSIKDNNGDWSSIPDSCKQTITVTGAGLTATPQPTLTTLVASPTPPPIGGVTTPSPVPTVAVAIPQIPTAGNALPAVITISGGAILLLLGWVIL